ncbi:FemAB family XrtA/PEP-CTERM system-associated protein [Aquisediminimonas sediminicola]|uniref:FemAB family XrtA/PEP-CTERM system-associated protein n=1 Tax=Alteraquisediminimonas sediminicola TaxID=2676787 RepID=UPI001FE8536A|nr:FemAB family XrtA/PEP-CTERM system-associated protein [Aquisediminimonas sediminicola]
MRPVIRLVETPGDAEIARIEAFVSTHPDATIFHRPCWLQAVEQGCGQRGLWLLAERGGVLTGMLPLTLVHSPIFGRALVSCGFAVGGGILAEDNATAALLAAQAVALAARMSCPTVELRGGHMLLEGWTLRDDQYAGFAHRLARDDEAALLAIPRKQRAEIRKAMALDLRVRIGRGEQDRQAHYAVYAESVRNLGTPVFPRSLFDAVLDRLGNDTDILTIWQADRPVASVLSLYHGQSVMPYWGGGTRAARQLRANELMYFSLMSHARNRDAMRFDFGRSKLGTGAYAYKKNWGFTPVPLRYAVHHTDGAVPRDINPLNPKYRAQIAMWKRLPLAVANRLGPMIARGLG